MTNKNNVVSLHAAGEPHYIGPMHVGAPPSTKVRQNEVIGVHAYNTLVSEESSYVDVQDISLNKVFDDNGLKKILSGELTVVLSIAQEPKKIAEMTDDEIIKETERVLAAWPNEPSSIVKHINLRTNLTAELLPKVALFRLLNNRSPTILELMTLQETTGPLLVK